MFAASLPGQGGRLRVRLVLLSVIATLLALPAGASALSVSKFAAGPIAPKTHCNPNLTPEKLLTAAAKRTDFCLAFYTTGGDPVKGPDVNLVRTKMPQGFLATSDTSPQCKLSDYNQSRGEPARCPADSQIGSGQAIVRVSVHGLILNRVIDAKVWNLEHTSNEVASIGVELDSKLAGFDLPKSKLIGRTTLRPSPDVGLITEVTGQPRLADLGSALGKHPLILDGYFLRFWGSKDDHPSLKQSFGLLGSDCSNDQVTRVEIGTTAGENSGKESRYRLTECDKVPFGADATVTPTERRPDVPTGLEVVVDLDQHTEPRVQSNLKSLTMTLPAGITLGPQVSTGEGGLPLCTDEQFGGERWGKSSCPAASKVADVQFTSPLQRNVFKGAAYLGQQPAPGELPQLFIDAGYDAEKIDAPRTKVRGAMRIDEQGRIETTIDHVAQVVFEQFKLTFRSGPHAPLVTPRECGTTTGEFRVAPSSGGAEVVRPLSLTIDEDCIDPRAFTPNIEIQPASTQAGARAPLTVVTERPDRSDRIVKIVHDLPAGFVSNLKLATECTVEQAVAVACPESSRVGKVVTTAGVGPAPADVPGEVFLAERQPGDVAGIIISSPVLIGDIDLGRLNIPARVSLRPEDQGLKLVADVPTHFKGIPLNIRKVAVTLDRDGFSINPTGCDVRSAVGTLTSEGGATVPITKPVQMTGCEGLGFAPTLGFGIEGETKTGSKPAVRVTIGLPADGSNMKSTIVALPLGIAADLKEMPRACDESAWNAGTCGENAVIGSLAAKLAISDEDIVGTVSLVRVPSETLPGIGLQLQGRFATRLLGKTRLDLKTGQTVNSFEGLPDVPLSVLQLNLNGGPRGALVTTKSLCANGTATMNGTFGGQSGASAKRDPQVDCAPAVAGAQASSGSVRVSGTLRKGLTLRVTPPPAGKVTGFRFSLPSGVSVKSARITKKKRLRGASTVSISGKRTVSSVIPKAGKTSLTVKVPKGAVQLTRKANRRSKWTVTFRVTYAGGKRQTLKATVRR